MTYDESSAGNYPVLLEYKIYVLGIIESSQVESSTGDSSSSRPSFKFREFGLLHLQILLLVIWSSSLIW